jgi:uncharacterized protein YndB with AHSA1/START domain
MTGSVFSFQREYEFAPVIVWDALIDHDLVSGWLGEAKIDLVIGGRYDVRWVARPGGLALEGVIRQLDEAATLEVDSAERGSFLIELEAFEGGSRGVGTLVKVTVRTPTEAVFVAQTRADWLTGLEQLEELLHGHPVDWSRWETDRYETWARHVGEERDSTA